MIICATNNVIAEPAITKVSAVEPRTATSDDESPKLFPERYYKLQNEAVTNLTV